MNAIANRAASAVASLTTLKQGLVNVQSTIKAAGGDPFLRLGRDGVWVYGAENLEVEEGSLWAINPLSIMHGWAAWTDHPGKQKNELVGELMVPMTSPLPAKSELRDVGWEYDQQLSFILKCVSEHDKDGQAYEDFGKQVLYKTTSVGGMTASKELIGKITAQLDKGTAIVPLVSLESSSYEHQKWGKTFTPVFNIQKWVELTDDLPAELVGEAAEEAAEQAPVEPVKADPEPAKPKRQTTPKVKAEPQAGAGTGTVAITDEDRRAALLAELEKLGVKDAALIAGGGAAPAAAEPTSSPAQTQTAAPGATLRRRRG